MLSMFVTQSCPILGFKIRNWQKFFCKMFHPQIRNIFFPGSLLSFLSHDESRCILFILWLFPPLSTQSSGAEVERILCSFHSTDLKWWPDQVSLAADSLQPYPVRSEHRTRNVEQVSTTLNCAHNLYLFMWSLNIHFLNVTIMTRQNPHCFLKGS